MQKALRDVGLDPQDWVVAEGNIPPIKIGELEPYYRFNPAAHDIFKPITGTVKIVFVGQPDLEPRFVFTSQGTVVVEFSDEWHEQMELLPIMRFIALENPHSTAFLVGAARSIEHYDRWVVILQ